MIRVYYLETEVVGGAARPRGIEYIHNAILEVEGTLRKLIQDTTTQEHDGLILVANSWREATEDEINTYNKFRTEYPEPEPPHSTHFAKISNFSPTDPKPLRVVRTWRGKDYTYDCFVTQDLVDTYQAGKLAVGDWVIVHFDDSGREVAMMKVFRSW